MLGSWLKTVVKTILSFLGIYEAWLLERVDVGKLVIFNLLLQPGWLDYNHWHVFGKSFHQQEYKVLRKGIDAGLSKQQICNLFNSQEAFWGIYLLSLPLKHLAFNVMERYKLTFTMIVRIFQIYQHWTPHKRICCCWTIDS